MVIINKYLEAWPVIVRREKGLRCIDIFCAIYDTYHEVLTPSELAHIGEAYLERCRPAFMVRCRDSPGLAEYNARRGLRRVDLLRGKRIFGRLTQTTGMGSKWILEFDDPRR